MATGTIKRGADSCGFPDPIVLHATEDLNDVKSTGLYRWASTNKPTHYPLNESGKMIVINRSSDEVDQLYFCASAANGMLIRTFYGTTWSNWYNVAVEEDISSHITPETGVTLNRARRIGNLVIVDLTAPKVTSANTQINLATIDSGYRPGSGLSYSGNIAWASTGDFGYGVVAANGSGIINMMYSKTTSYGLYCTVVYFIG